MFVLRALHSFAARLVDRKPNKSHLRPELERAANDSWILVTKEGYTTLLLLLSTEDIK